MIFWSATTLLYFLDELIIMAMVGVRILSESVSVKDVYDYFIMPHAPANSSMEIASLLSLIFMEITSLLVYHAFFSP